MPIESTMIAEVSIFQIMTGPEAQLSRKLAARELVGSIAWDYHGPRNDGRIYRKPKQNGWLKDFPLNQPSEILYLMLMVVKNDVS